MKRPKKLIWTLVGLSSLCGLAAVINTTHYYRTSRHNRYALTSGILEQDMKAVRQALANGANAKVINFGNEINSPLALACIRGNCEILKLLTDAGADPAKFTDNGNVSDLLHVTIGGLTEYPRTENVADRAKCITLLVEQGLDPNRKTSHGYPIFKAVRHRFEAGLTALIDGGADVNVRHVLGNTALHKISMREVYSDHDLVVDQNMAQLILDADCDLTLKNEASETALDVAIKNKRTDLEKLIRDHMSENE